MKINKSACLVIISLSLLVSANAIPWPVDPQNTAHATNKTYGDWNGFTVDMISCLGYHGGVDIPADSGTPVLAVIDGVVSNFRRGTGSDTGFINIAVDDNSSLAWSYQHILLHDTLVQNGDSVHIGDTLGYVARFQGFADNDHLHFQRSNNNYDELTGYLNPLDSLSPSPTQTPYILDRPPGVPHHPK